MTDDDGPEYDLDVPDILVFIAFGFGLLLMGVALWGLPE